jgi:hypothetical protein
MNLYTQEELDRIKKCSEKNQKMEDFFQLRMDEWNSKISPLFDVLKEQLTNSSKIMENQALALSYKQLIIEQISHFLSKRSKEETHLKRLKQDKFVLYAVGSPLKTNTGEKIMLIEGHIAENQRTLELIENYIEFLRSCSKNLDSFSYAIKNIIDLMNYLGR